MQHVHKPGGWTRDYKDANVYAHGGTATEGLNYSYGKLNQWNMQTAAVPHVADKCFCLLQWLSTNDCKTLELQAELNRETNKTDSSWTGY